MMNSAYWFDLQRYRGGGKFPVLHLLYWFRKSQNCKFTPVRLLSLFMLSIYRKKYNIEISSRTKIGKGLYLGHARNILINPEAVIGDNCNIHGGAVIGQTNRGEKKGVPTIGNEVYIGINAVIVGKIQVGDDVLIAANSFVNVDVSSHSVVLGNPCIIKHKDNATEGYINNKV